MHITKEKKPIWKDYILFVFNYMTFWKRQSYGNSKNITGGQDLAWRRGGVGRAQKTFRAVKIFWMVL